ncbi:geranylgeranyl diphosphate synthase, type II [Pedobacter steynii]|jgi:geranylgeranyl diphosphate synthase type II|uniref:Geranylgeranyl diphosphate synthase, type II n=1 Tax=Pedobacter steynii TaxID=430522 RepID=A0A1G9QX10_9SPHI|nr:polyprenyl synthetase family protein [Pedobacter steynii]NQX37956.1 polyprenyl synthetase family protein [Pedobacter steynii]SDM15524.1 geranylgeranyl diphosphate synthase, type II [Pedobacter steynii]
MYTPAQLQEIIENAIQNVPYPSHPERLYQPISYIMSLGGKRIRPALVLMAADLFGADLNKAIPAALAIETFHNFTLIHDDIMDNAPLRRGKPSVHEKWGVNNAILSGDVMMVESNKHLSMLDTAVLKDALNTFNATAQGVCEGQQLDMEFEERDFVSIEEYINMIRLKTAVLLGGAMKLGAQVAGATAEEAEQLYQFGENIGIAFQLQDDILDVYGDPEKFGKQVGGDIIANKKTLLLLKLKELAGDSDLQELEKQSVSQDFEDKISNTTLLYNKYNIRELATTEMRNYSEKAFNALSALAVPEERKRELILLSNQLMNREH